MPEPLPHPGMPRWLRLSLLVGAAVVVAVVVLVLVVGGSHGPQQHGLAGH